MLLEAYAEAEAELEAGPYRSYREILGEVADRLGARFGVGLSGGARSRFAASVADWPAFGDSADALTRLKQRYRLGVISNCDDDLLATSLPKLGVAFDWVVSAQQVGSYKPSEANFVTALGRIGVPRDRVLHVAQSLYHDHVPAKRLGLRTVWVNRRHGRPGSGATPPTTASPDLEVPDLATLAAFLCRAG